MKKTNEAPGLQPFRVEPAEPVEPGVDEFKGWLPAGSDSGITDEDTGRVNLESLRRIIRSLIVSEGRKKKKHKKRKKKCDDLHGKCPGHWYAGGISTAPVVGGGSG